MTARREAKTDHCLPEAYAAWEEEQKRLRQEAILHRRGFETLAKATAAPAQEQSLVHRTNWEGALLQRTDLLSRLHRHDVGRIAYLEARLDHLETQLTCLQDINARLRLKLHTQRRIKPSPTSKSRSENAFSEKPEDKPQKRRGAPKGHRGASRKIPDKVDHTHVIPPPEQCGCGGRHVLPIDQFDRKYIQDIPPVCCVTTRLEYQHGICRDCGQVVWHNEGFHGPPVVLGPNLQAHLTMMRQLGCTLRKLAVFCTETLGIPLTPSGVLGVINRTGNQLLPAYREIAGQLSRQDYLHGDETGWKTRGEKRNLWTACNQDLAYFHIDASRGSDVPKRLLGSDFAGVVVCDFHGAYNFLPKTQRCLIHLLRDIHDECQLHPGNAALKDFRESFKELIKAALKLQKASPTAEKDKHFEELTKELDQLAQMKLPGKAANLAKRIAKHRDSLLRFVHHPGLDYHNNRAERQLRPSVIARKTSFGSDTDHGAHRHCIINSVIQTCRLQNRSPIDYLMQAINAPPGIPPSIFDHL